ncbi:MAG: PqqD family protein [Prevotella sp.]|nr:PqqD family protein [Prevotella sp.]
MKLKPSIELHDMGNTVIAVCSHDDGSPELYRFNATGGFILQCLQTETQVETVATQLVQHYDISEAEALAGVSDFVAQIADLGLLA